MFLRLSDFEKIGGTGWIDRRTAGAALAGEGTGGSCLPVPSALPPAAHSPKVPRTYILLPLAVPQCSWLCPHAAPTSEKSWRHQ